MSSSTIAWFLQSSPLWALILGAVTTGVGSFFLRHYLIARQFRRMSVAGVQMFSSYINMYLTRACEQAAWLFSKLLLILCVVSTLMAFVKWFLGV
jgi:hypothetical protein